VTEPLGLTPAGEIWSKRSIFGAKRSIFGAKSLFLAQKVTVLAIYRLQPLHFLFHQPLRVMPLALARCARSRRPAGEIWSKRSIFGAKSLFLAQKVTVLVIYRPQPLHFLFHQPLRVMPLALARCARSRR
jgi:hypothetical protein